MRQDDYKEILLQRIQDAVDIAKDDIRTLKMVSDSVEDVVYEG